MVPDPFRTIPARHLGHGFAGAEALGDNVSSTVHDLCSSLATGYIVMHAIHRSLRMGGGPMLYTAFFDTLIFEGLASAIIPSVICFHVRSITTAVVQEITNVPEVVIKWAPVVVSTATLLYTWTHIDRMVDDLMNQTIRSFY